MTQTILAILIIIASVAYAIYIVVRRLNTPGDCGCGHGRDCPYKQKKNKSDCKTSHHQCFESTKGK